MILITFLGTNNYNSVIYQWNDQTRETALFPTAVPQFFPELTAAKVFVTKESQAMHGASLEANWPTDWRPEFIPIPSGANSDELWTIFDAIVDAVPPDAQVVFDITHAFRSIPLISVLAVAYLWSTRNVQLQALVYGAYDARTGEPPVAPVFDLTPMVNLLEWLAAVERFRHHLDGTPLRDLLGQTQRRAHQEKATQPPLQLKSAGNQLSQLTDALLLGRVREVLRNAPGLSDTFAGPVLAQEAGRWAKPLLLVMEPIRQLLDEIGRSSELDLTAHRRLAHLYGTRRLYMPAITVFREWVVSRACRLAGLSDAELIDEKRRGQIEAQLGRHLHDKIDRPAPDRPAVSDAWLQGPESRELLDLWTRLPHLRNDVDHAGMKKEDKSASALIKNITSLVLTEPAAGSGHDAATHITLDISTLYAATGTAKLADLPLYEQQARDAVPPGAEVTLTGAGPVWLYLKIGHALHGRARRLFYDSPVTGNVLVFDHSPE